MQVGWQQVGAPLDEPVTVAELRAQCRIDADVTAEDAQLLVYIMAARQAVEVETGRQLLRATYLYGAEDFPAHGAAIELPMPPLLRIVSIYYRDSAGQSVLLDAADYLVDTISLPGAVALPNTGSWPSVQAQRNAVQVRYEAGYGDDGEQIPQGLRMAVLLWAASLYEQREATVEKALSLIPMGVDRLLNPYRTAAVLIG